MRCALGAYPLARLAVLADVGYEKEERRASFEVSPLWVGILRIL
jgi:hypothetical protein